MSCSHPKVIKNRLVPCGCCINCRKKRQNDWAVRLDIERKLNQDKSLFITLTYSDEYLPEDGLLNKRDYQLFIKRLRKAVAPVKLRYFLSGEYGDKYGRPHYHLILFGLELNQENIKLINDKWSMGFIKVFPVTWKNCRYVAKYSVKQFQKEKKGFKVDGITGEVTSALVSEFVSMSKNKGLGFSIFENSEFSRYFDLERNSVKIGDFSYSIPYAFKKKMKEIGIEFKKEIVVLYNEKYFVNGSETFKKSNVLYDLCNCCCVDWMIKDYSFNKVKLISFKEYLKDLRLETVREKNFCKIRKIDYFDFYLDKIKKFFPYIFSKDDKQVKKSFIEDWYDDFREIYFSKDGNNFCVSYFNFFENFLYSNFYYLFY